MLDFFQKGFMVYKVHPTVDAMELFGRCALGGLAAASDVAFRNLIRNGRMREILKNYPGSSFRLR